MHAIDTHKAVTRLETAGLSRQTAEAVVEIFDTASNVATADLFSRMDALSEKQQTLANKDDVEKVEKEMATRDDVERIEKNMATRDELKSLANKMGDLTGRVDHIEKRVDHIEKNMATRDDVERIEKRLDHIEKNMATKGELAEIKVDIIRWNIGLIIAFAALMIALAKLL